ncbi:branched-chain amino acid ABC transporter permease [Trinickia dabaoshanensis]|uniref:Branched-chain amino acid ABC transporter permease n=1 Tax=Trinickia dabaoshanensis TaxID=564714 RepID=A0A2N7VTA0_9BURK|nr:branched-chain amino acid ABC transporter permease [Trinickia dabaoshanensis]PMS20386.1 branched-chain amino acid ABC transporter permease [Trinickia dabaoshanensis]
MPDPRLRLPPDTSAAARAAPWIALALLLALPLAVLHESWLIAYFAQAAAMIVLALSYNLLLGETGLLSFGHAAFAGLGAFAAAHLFNRGGIALPWLPLVGGAGGAAFGLLFGLVATRRAGTAFAMITLGIGELAAAAVWTLPEGFGGAAGVTIDRGSAATWGGLTFGPEREAYALIASWAALAIVAMFALTRTPLVRMANAVRENAARVAALGIDPRRVRLAMFVIAAFFAGIAGTLTLIDVELASSESVAMTRSGAVLIATVIGGTSTFFGPVLGALVLTALSVALASVTRAWPVYLGLSFIAVVSCLPEGIAGWWARHGARARRYGVRTLALAYALGTAAGAAWGGALVIAVESLYARRFAADAGGVWRIGSLAFDLGSGATWSTFAVLVAIGAGSYALTRICLRRAGEARLS